MNRVLICFGKIYEKNKHFYAQSDLDSKSFETFFDSLSDAFNFVVFLVEQYKKEHLSIPDISTKVHESVLVVFYGSGIQEEACFETEGILAKHLKNNTFNEILIEYKTRFIHK